MAGRGILAGSTGAVAGMTLGGALGWGVYRMVDPGIEPWGRWLLELRGPVASIVLVGAGAGLLLGSTLALAVRGYRLPLLTTLLVLGFLPFTTPLVLLAGRLGPWAAGLTGVLMVAATVTAARWLVTRALHRRGPQHPLPGPRPPASQRER